MERRKPALVVALDLSDSDLRDVMLLTEFRDKLVHLAVHSNPKLSSLDGLQQCSQLWSLDLSNCSLASVEPLASLGALGTLRLGDNLLELSAVARLAAMHIGQLEVAAGNPLLPADWAFELKPGDIETGGVLRAALVHTLPQALSLDGSFVTLYEREQCEAFFAAHAEAAPLLAHSAAGGAAPPLPVSSAAPQAAALVKLFVDTEALRLTSPTSHEPDLRR